ncbi:MAG TPA: electron transfer flavoprotein subunit alpha/FixB family protein [bacterium]|nr:electron transfer flavoprotein subunit alpha/FixB family protein [bacterium]
MASGVMIVAEHRDGKLRKISLELLGVGKKLAGELGGGLSACVIGKGVEGLAKDLGKFGAEKVFVCDADIFAAYSPDGFAAALAAAAKQADPALILMGASVTGKDLAPRAAAKLGTGLSSDCVDVKVEGGKVICKRPVYSGKCFARTEAVSSPAMVSVRPNVFPAAAEVNAAGAVVKVDAGVSSVKAKVKELKVTATGRPELTEAERIVSGGRGMKDKANFKILEDLADAIHAAVGASRAAVDSGYADVSQQVGQTGKVVNPTLYLAFGISGAIQHLAGMRTSKVIVAVNKDADAPIFQKADYGIVDDLFKVVPVMTEELKKMLAE